MDVLRQGHGQDTAAGAGKSVGDIVVLRKDGLGVRHGGQDKIGFKEVSWVGDNEKEDTEREAAASAVNSVEGTMNQSVYISTA
jgi:hypothetical protein